MVLLSIKLRQSRFFRAADLQVRRSSHQERPPKSRLVGTERRRSSSSGSPTTTGACAERVNNRTIRGAFGDPVDGWTGKVIVLFPTMADFRGTMKPASAGAHPAAEGQWSNSGAERCLSRHSPQLDPAILTTISMMRSAFRKLAAAPGSKQSRRLCQKQSVVIRHNKAKDTTAQPCKAAARAGAADRAAAVVRVALEQKPDGKWQKPPFMATQPDRHASTNDPARGQTTPQRWRLCRPATPMVSATFLRRMIHLGRSIWIIAAAPHARSNMGAELAATGRNTYPEVTPSGEGIRLWGFANGDRLNRNTRWRSTANRSLPSCSGAPTRH